MQQNKEQPYERFLSSGPGSLTNAELLGIILRTGTKGVSAVELGRRVLGLHDPKCDSLSALPALSMEELRALPGIGEVKAVKLLCLSEIARRIVREKIRNSQKFDSPDKIADYYMESMRHLNKEQTVVLHFDSKMSLLGEDIMTVGTVSGALISPREIFIKALQRQAVRIVLLHNHPSGDPTPSREDITLQNLRSRPGLLAILSVILALVIVGRLYYLQILRGEEFSQSFEKSVTRTVSIPAKRGRILDRNGVVIADTVASQNVTIVDNTGNTREENARLNDIILKTLQILDQNSEKTEGDFGISWDGSGYVFNYSGFEHLRIWRRQRAQFVSIEPWTTLPDQDDAEALLSRKSGIETLPPGKTRQYKHLVTWIE